MQQELERLRERFHEAQRQNDWPMALYAFDALAAFIAASPCDPDVTVNQREAWARIVNAAGIPGLPDCERTEAERLPTLEDIHAMKLRPPGGMSVEEYLDDLRGED